MPITEDFLKRLMEQNSILLSQNVALSEQNAAMAEQISQLTKTVESLNQTIQKLQEQLNKNSKNSSKQPSSDGFKKPPVNKERSLCQSSGKKQGGQEGHTGKYLSVTSNPDHVEQHMHSACNTCPYHDSCLRHACVKETRHEIDTVVKTSVTAHELTLVKDCPLHGGRMQGTFPKHVKATVQYGQNLQALVVALNTVGAVSINRTHEILGSVFNIPLATGTINNMVSIKKAKETAMASGKDSINCNQLEKFDKQYDEIIKTAYAENPLPETTEKKRGRKKKSKVLNLIGRLDKYKASVCLFIRNFCVPFDNNQAERDIRMVKVKTKVSGCFRSMEGAQEYLTIMSYIGTARKHGINPYEAIRSAISGNPDIIFG